MKLYELTAEYERFMHDVEDGIIPDECIEDTLESITGALEVKADNIACIIKGLEAEADAIAAEKKRLERREKTMKNRVERLKSYLSNALVNSNMLEINTARNRITFLKSEAVEVADEAAFIEKVIGYRDDLLRYKSPEIDKTALKEAINRGYTFDGVSVVTRQNIQIK